jgi:inorganic triphosphatase YgiF
VEIELQYLYRGDRPAMIPVELADFVLGDSESYSVLDTYHDTDRLALRRSGCSLRIRSQGNLPRPLLTWKGPATRRPDGSKSREELQVALDHVPRDGNEVAAVLHRLDLWERVCARAGIDEDSEVHEIGQLRNRRSAHHYKQGMHRLELTWDSLQFPIGEPQTRIEVEVKSAAAARFLGRVDEELRALYGPALDRAPHGKTKELCLRLYPELMLDAQVA